MSKPPVPVHDPTTLALEVATTPTGLPNLAKNPSGALGAWGYQTPVTNTVLTSNGQQLTFTTTPSQAAYFTTELLPVTAGEYVAARFDAVAVTASHNVKLRLEWYDAAKALLSSSVQSAALGMVPGVNYYNPIVAPASTAYVRLRFDLYNGAANPSAAAAITLTKVMVTKAATAGAIATVRTNLYQDPSAVGTAYASTASTTATEATTAAQSYTGTTSYLATSGPEGYMRIGHTLISRGAMPDGATFTASVYVRSATVARTFTPRLEFRNVNLAPIGALNGTTVTSSTGGWTRITVTATAPSGYAYVEFAVTVNGTANGEGHYLDAFLVEQSGALGAAFDGSFSSGSGTTYAWTGTANASTSTETKSDFGYSEPVTWRNVLGPSHAIRVERKALDLGILEASIFDALLDPAVSSDLAPGKAVRCRALSGSVWESLFEGKIDNAEVSYDLDNRRPAAPARLLGTNLLPNPSAEVDVAGWTGSGHVASVVRDTGQAAVGAASFAVTTSNTTPQVYGGGTGTAARPVTAGETLRLSAQCRAGATARQIVLQVAYWTAGGVAVATNNVSIGTFDATAGWTTVTGTDVVPATAAFAALVVAWTGCAVGEIHYFDAAMMLRADEPMGYFDGSTADTDTLDYAWTGTAHASASTVTRKAVPLRLATTITMTALDAVAQLRNQSESRGVATVAALPHLLEGRGVPWNVNGSGNQVPTATILSVNENAKILDQVALTRDTVRGYAWVDRRGVLTVYDAAQLPATIAATFSDAAGSALSYTQIDAGFSTAECINEVTVRLLRYLAATGETEEVVYGPYRDQASIDTYGAFEAEFTIQAPDDTGVAAYAAAVLAANKTPVRRARGLRLMVSTASDRAAAATLDLYTKVTVVLSGILNSAYPISSIVHTITPDAWTVDYGFTVSGAVASPSTQPSPIVTDPSDGTWLTPALAAPYTAGAIVPKYRRRDGRVTVRGLVNRNAAADGAVVFTLPAGYRPGEEWREYSDSVPVATSSGRVTVGTDGTVRCYLKTGAPTSYYVYVDFPAEA